MKKFLFALTAVIAIAGMALSPVSAAPSPSRLANEECGSTYTVQHRDNLSKIAAFCDTTVADILLLNPQIEDANLIFTGQVLRVSGSVSTPVDYATTYIVQSGDTLAEIADDFGVTVLALRQANPVLWYDGVLFTGQVLYIPARTKYASTSDARVTLSATRAGPGDEITVFVSGFPANSWIDYRVGQENKDYSVVYDGTVGKDGTDSLEITIPNDADDGEYWVVVVTTTSQAQGVEVTSSRITIDE